MSVIVSYKKKHFAPKYKMPLEKHLGGNNVVKHKCYTNSKKSRHLEISFGSLAMQLFGTKKLTSNIQLFFSYEIRFPAATSSTTSTLTTAPSRCTRIWRGSRRRGSNSSSRKSSRQQRAVVEIDLCLHNSRVIRICLSKAILNSEKVKFGSMHHKQLCLTQLFF